MPIFSLNGYMTKFDLRDDAMNESELKKWIFSIYVLENQK